MNRLLRFVTNERLRLIFTPTPTPGSDGAESGCLSPYAWFSGNGNGHGGGGKSDAEGVGWGSFEWRRAMDEGWIVLVNLSTTSGRLSGGAANTLCTLLLTDLWTTARERGKSSAGRGFYVYADEFQRFVTPDIAESLDEARGYGLHLTLAHQFPTQLKNQGENGKRVYDSILGSAANKVVFRSQHPKDVEMLAAWMFRDVLDPNEIKLEVRGTKVLGHRVARARSHHEGTTSTEGGAGATAARAARARGSPTARADPPGTAAVWWRS